VEVKAFSLPPDPQHGLENSAAGCAAVALEHQMFEGKVREPDYRRLVGGADLVPDHLAHYRGAVIGDHHDLHAVGKREVWRDGSEVTVVWARTVVAETANVKNERDQRASKEAV